MVEAVEPFKLHPTSMSYIYKVFEHLNSLTAKSCYGGEKKMDLYFQVGTYRVAVTINKFMFLFYIRRNLL